jgi:hypothetical protein
LHATSTLARRGRRSSAPRPSPRGDRSPDGVACWNDYSPCNWSGCGIEMML